MGVRILHDAQNNHACLYDSVSDVAFGPVFYGHDCYDQAVHFTDWLGTDARLVNERGMLRAEYATWFNRYLDDATGELTAKAAAHVVTVL